MKTPILSGLLVGVFLPWAAATVVSTGEMQYPVNMGPDADPARIPVGSIPCESNHGYGTLELISTPFPSVPGGWHWEGGIELNGNLPSAFGISVQPKDTTDARHAPVVLHVRKQATPGYSPYSKEQVLLATMRCLLDAVRATPRAPLVLEVVTDDPADKALRRFSGEYVTRPAGDDEFEETPLPGCVAEVDRNGIRTIVFAVKGTEPKPDALENPIWMPFPVEGDCDPEYLLLPMWPGNGLTGERLDLLGKPWPLVQDRFNEASGDPDGNLLTRHTLIRTFRTSRTDDKVSLAVSLNPAKDQALDDGMALLCWAAVLSEHPTPKQPLEVTLRLGDGMDPRFRAWVGEGAWEQIAIAGDVGLRMTFTWDEETGSLTTGTIPKYRVDRRADGGWEVTDRKVYDESHKDASPQPGDLP
jgi:hypothetical protein